MIPYPLRCLCTFLLIATASTHPAGAGNADIGPVVNPANGHSYYVIDALMNWADAEVWAVSLGGHLVAINDAPEDAWMQANLGLPGGYYWLGAQDNVITTDAVFEWITGEPFTYQNFLPGEPDDDAAFGGFGDYLALSATDGAWLDTNGTFVGLVTGAIAEVPAPVGVDPPSLANAGILLLARPTVTDDFTRLSFTLPGAASVSCRVFDVRGRRVRTIAEGILEEGQHELTWDTRDDGARLVRHGVYVVRLQAGGSSSSRKVIVTR